MIDHVLPSRRGPRVAAIAVATAAALITTYAVAQQPAAPASGYTYVVETLATGVNNGYQLALDPVNRKVYFADTRWRTEVRDPDGTIRVTQTGTGKVVVFDAASRNVEAIHSFLNLTRNDGNGHEGDPFDWTGVTANSLTSQRTQFSPYGIAVDGRATNAWGQLDPIIITTTARGRDDQAGYGGHVVVYRASQGAPTDADRIFEFDDGTPIFDGIRRVAVNTLTHRAYVTNFGESRGGVVPGFIAVIDLLTKKVEARIRIPGDVGAIGVDVDEANNLIYVGSMVGEKLYVIDGSEIVTTDAKNVDLNAGAIRELAAVVGANARPTYNAELKRLYVSAYASPVGTITVVDADPRSAAYGTVVATIQTGPTNSVAVDGERGLLYSANLGAREVVVYSTTTHAELLRLPTTGNALNIGIDPVTHNVWVANFSNTSFVNIFTVRAPAQ